jgi:hypothetical protein
MPSISVEIEKVLTLIKAICTRVEEIGGLLNKTKLLKIIYLIDVEYYKIHKEKYTGFNWIFFEYGPWAYEYNSVFDFMQSSPDFEIDKTACPYEAVSIACPSEKVDFADIFPSSFEAMAYRNIVNRWSLESLNQLLNYVYFYTEPMAHAIKFDKLDFSKIHKLEPIPDFTLEKGNVEQNEIKELRKRLAEGLNEAKKAQIDLAVTPQYDDVFWSDMLKMDFDDEY